MKAIIKTYWVITEDELGHKRSYVYEGTFTSSNSGLDIKDI